MLGKKAGHNERIRTARYKNDGLALTQAGTGRGGAFGVGSCREKIQLVLLEEGGKIGAVEQDRDPSACSSRSRRASMVSFGARVLS